MLDYHSFLHELDQLVPRKPKKQFLLAVSGGLDSMVLAHLFLTNNFSFEIAHVNYHLRGKDSDLDEELVRDFAQENQIPFHLYDVSERDRQPTNSIELWAREIRYRYFFQLLEERNLDFIATAHHLNDELETFIINLSRASGIAGLSGIPRNENQILRPLLSFTKKEIDAFAKENQIQYREDSTNHEDNFLRNRIRHHLIPELEKTNPHFWRNFSKSLDYLKQTNDFIQQKLNDTLLKITIEKTNLQWILDQSLLRQEASFMRFQVLKYLGFPDPAQQEKIFNAKNGSRFLTKDTELYLHDGNFYLLRNAPSEDFADAINVEFNEQLTTPENLFISKEKQSEWPICWEINAQSVKLPLKLRKPQVGEYFYPVGMTGKKKISKFFKDERIPTFARHRLWILSDAKDQILGIVGKRQDRRFAATENDNEKIFVHQALDN